MAAFGSPASIQCDGEIDAVMHKQKPSSQIKLTKASRKVHEVNVDAQTRHGWNSDPHFGNRPANATNHITSRPAFPSEGNHSGMQIQKPEFQNPEFHATLWRPRAPAS